MSENLSNNQDNIIIEATGGIRLNEVDGSLLDDSILDEGQRIINGTMVKQQRQNNNTSAGTVSAENPQQSSNGEIPNAEDPILSEPGDINGTEGSQKPQNVPADVEGQTVNAQEQPQQPSTITLKAGDPILPGQGGSNGTDGNPIQQQEADKAPKAEGSNVGGQPELLAQGKSQQSTKPVVVGEPPRTQIQETRLKSKEPEKKTELANKEDIVNENNTEIARLIMNTRTDNGFNYARMSEARIMNDIIEKQGKEIKILRTDKNNLMNLIKGSTSIMKKNNDLKERQFKQTAKEINSRTNITGLHVEVSEPIIPNKVDFTQLEKLMNEAEAEFNTQYDTFENVLENANSDLDTLNNLYTKNIDILKKFRE